MPDELAKAAGVEYAPPSGGLGSVFGLSRRRTEAEKAASTDFGAFLDVLKARCETWEMEGDRDWRRDDVLADVDDEELDEVIDLENANQRAPLATAGPAVGDGITNNDKISSKQPRHYHLASLTPLSGESAPNPEIEWNNQISSLLAEAFSDTVPATWSPSRISVYGRQVPVQASTPTGYTLWAFPDLCSTNLGPADYISLASTYHTFILDSVPILTLIQRNEARRFITLLDALYESKCRLLIRAEAPPDALFFPETQIFSKDIASGDTAGDAVYQETLAEIYQDRTSPFRPNVSSYREESGAGDSATPTQSLLNPKLRSVLADEDADFGPVYGNGRGHGASTALLGETERRQQASRGPDFTKTGSLTGEDERFAYKRARSRIWEMCGERWWRERPADKVEEWWRPVTLEGRFWEGRAQLKGKGAETLLKNGVSQPLVGTAAVVDGSHDGRQRKGDTALGVGSAVHGDGDSTGLFRHGASPFRTRTDPPPKFGWQHAWGMVTWGRKAGEWGKGVEGRKKMERGGEQDEEGGK